MYTLRRGHSGTIMDELIEALLECPDAEARQTLRQSWAQPFTGLQLIQALKARADALLRADPPTARRLAEIAQEVAASSDDPLCRATAAWAAGNAGFYGGEYRECLAYYRQAIPAFEQAGSSLEAGRLRANCVAVLTDLGRCAEALAEAEVARPALVIHGPTRFLASLEMNATVLHRHLDDYGAALAACDRGREIALALDNAIMVARFDVNRALILENLDSYRAAIAALLETLPVFERHGETLELARARLNLGLLHTRAGHYRQALTELEISRQGFAAQGNAMEVAVTDWHCAGVYLKLNLLPEVIEHNATARAVFVQRGLVRQAALADSEAAQAYHRLGEPKEADRLIQRSRAVLVETGPLPVQLAQLDLLEASFHLADGALAAALICAERGLAGLARGPFPIKRAAARLMLADCYRAVGRPDEAHTAYREALDIVGPAGLADLTYRAQLGLGQLAETQGDAAGALAWYRQALEVATRASFGLGGSEFRAAFLADKLAAHQAAVLLHLAGGDLPAAFVAAEAARISAGRLLSLAAGFPEYGADDPGSAAELAQRREEWNWLYSRLDRGRWATEPGDPAPAARGGVDEAAALSGLAAAERRLADLLRSAGRPGPAAAAPPADLAAVQACLAPDEALLAYFVTRDQVVGFRVDRQSAVAIPDLVSVEDARGRLDRLRFALHRESDEAEEHLAWFYRVLVAGLARPADAIPLAQADKASQGLSPARPADVIPPAQAEKAPQGLGSAAEAAFQFQTGGFNPWASSIRRLYIVPHDLLYHLPFHALCSDDGRYLLESYEIVYLPAASWLRRQTFEVSETLRRTQGKLSKVSQRALIVGHDHAGRLPAALREAQAVHDILAEAATQTGIVPRLLLAGDATEARLREHASEAGILHLATHGVFRQDNPLFSALRLADGWLTLADVERMDLRQAGLVTLSACETGAGDLRGGDLFGLSQAFLAAGAASLVASLWPVPDEATRQLMIGFYCQLVDGQSKAAALRAAQLTLMAQPAYRHPLHWAGFVLMGESGGL